jgi:hypothetical protein
VADTEQSEPREPEAAPSGRAATRMRDLIGSLAVLLLVIVAIVGFGRGCSFRPGGPSIDPNSAPSVDASRELGAAATRVDFPVRRPQLPAGWRANSASTSAVGSGASVIVRVGWLTPLGGFAQLSQSAGDPADVVAAETGRDDAVAGAAVEVAGTRWTTYPGRRAEQAWVSRLGGVTTLITGSAGTDEFRVLAGAVQAAQPLPRS